MILQWRFTDSVLCSRQIIISSKIYFMRHTAIRKLTTKALCIAGKQDGNPRIIYAELFITCYCFILPLYQRIHAKKVDLNDRLASN